jgi:plasmid stability protein
MGKMIQIRNVPPDLHRRLKSKAALEGLSLSDYLLRELQKLDEVPTLAELVERIRKRGRVHPAIDSAKIIREMRGE